MRKIVKLALPPLPGRGGSRLDPEDAIQARPRELTASMQAGSVAGIEPAAVTGPAAA